MLTPTPPTPSASLRPPPPSIPHVAMLEVSCLARPTASEDREEVSPAAHQRVLQTLTVLKLTCWVIDGLGRLKRKASRGDQRGSVGGIFVTWGMWRWLRNGNIS